MVQNGPKWFKMVQNGSKWFKLVQTCSNGPYWSTVGATAVGVTAVRNNHKF